LDKRKYLPVIVLPFDGPLKTELEKNNIKVVIAPVLKLYRKMFTPINLIKFFREYKEGLRTLDKLNQEYNFKLVYSHTLAALIGIVFAKRRNIKHLWHIQEIIKKPRIFNFIFKKLLSLKCNNKAVYDSVATMNCWTLGNKELIMKSETAWNGIETNETPTFKAEELDKVREIFFSCKKHEIVIALVGRINSWKGQHLLLKAYDILLKTNTNIKLIYIGSAPPNQDFFEIDLKNKIKEFNLEEKVVLLPFQKEISKFWNSIDIAVVPSTEPEPFGMVLIEAMLAKKPVVASNHGGPTEIIVDNETGFLFEPNNEKLLAASIQKLIDNSEIRNSFGEKGYQRVLDTFSLENHVNQFEKIFNEILNK
jgi:glycosyltransferase involved in cell wall biosynthesis